MKNSTTIFKNQIIFLFLIFIILGQVNCKLEIFSLLFNPTQPASEKTYESSDVGIIQILKVNPDLQPSINADLTKSNLFNEKIIFSNSDDVLRVGCNEFGFCMLRFNEGDLKKM